MHDARASFRRPLLAFACIAALLSLSTLATPAMAYTVPPPATMQACFTRDGIAQAGATTTIVSPPYSVVTAISDGSGCVTATVSGALYAFYFDALTTPLAPQRTSTIIACVTLNGVPEATLPMALLYLVGSTPTVVGVKTDGTGCGTTLAFAGPYQILGTKIAAPVPPAS